MMCDTRWTNYYNQAPKGSDIDPKEFANILWKTEKMARRLRTERLSKGVKFITADKCPKERAETRHPIAPRASGVKCQAITMTGKPCPFRATSGCGKFCKKHIIVE